MWDKPVMYSTVEWRLPPGTRTAGLVRYDPFIRTWLRQSMYAISDGCSIQAAVRGHTWEGTLLMVYE